jgi:hypothetical protein
MALQVTQEQWRKGEGEEGVRVNIPARKEHYATQQRSHTAHHSTVCNAAHTAACCSSVHVGRTIPPYVIALVISCKLCWPFTPCTATPARPADHSNLCVGVTLGATPTRGRRPLRPATANLVAGHVATCLLLAGPCQVYAKGMVA